MEKDQKQKPPFLEDLNENTLKIRRNLLFISFSTLFCIYHKIDLGKVFKINIDQEIVYHGSSLIIFYLLIHFAVNSYDWFIGSGCRFSQKRRIILFSKINEGHLPRVSNRFDSSLDSTKTIKWTLRENSDNYSKNPEFFISHLEELEKIDRSLERYTMIQICRILTIEIGIPILLGFIALTSIYDPITINYLKSFFSWIAALRSQ